MRPSPLALCTLVLFAGAAGPTSSAAPGPQAGAPPAATLLRLDADVQRDGRLRSQAARLDADAIELAALPGGLLVLPNPDGGQLSYDYVSHTRHASGDLTWVGRAEGAPLGQEAVVTVGPDAAFGRLPRPDGSVMQLETVGGQIRLMVDDGFAVGAPSDVQLDDARRPPLEEIKAALAQAQAQAAAKPAGDRLQANPTQVDIMLAFTPGLATYVGGDAATRTLLQNRIDLANTALANGNVNGSFRLVATPKVDFPDTGSNSSALDQITYWKRDTAPPVAFQLATLRHRHGADIVGLVRRFLKEESVSCGNGWVGGYQGQPISGYFDFGYFTANHGSDGGSFCSDRTIGHEIGHNLGQNHDIVTAVDRDGAHTYSHGYRVSPPGKTGFYTVMAYRDSSASPAQVPALTFSNPAVVRADCANEACGLADANAAGSLSLTIPGAAAWFKPADELPRDIASTSGHLVLDLAGLPALTNARWRAEFTGTGTIRVTGPTVAAAGAPVQAKLAWDALPGTPSAPLAVRLVVESSPGVFAAERNLTLTRREWVPAARVLADGVPTTVAVPNRSPSADESRIYVPLPPHARNLRINVSSAVDVDVYATFIPESSVTYPQIGAGIARTNGIFFNTGGDLNKTLDVQLPANGGTRRVMITLARPNSGSLNYRDATITATVTQQDPAPAFQSGQYFNPDRSGHGVFVDSAGPQWVAVWYTYLEDGTPTWYYSEAAAPAPGGPGIWSAPLFRVGWNGSATTATEVGRMVVTPTDATSMVFSYNLDGDSGSERLVRLGGAGCPTSQGAPLNATGHWFSPSLSGFGYSAQYEPDQEIYAAYLYDAAGVARWLIGAKPWNDAVNVVNLEQISGSCPTCGYTATSSQATGQLTRTLGQNGDGQRGLTQINTTATLLAPLSGSWSQSRATALLSARKGCP